MCRVRKWTCWKRHVEIFSVNAEILAPTLFMPNLFIYFWSFILLMPKLWPFLSIDLSTMVRLSCKFKTVTWPSLSKLTAAVDTKLTSQGRYVNISIQNFYAHRLLNVFWTTNYMVSHVMLYYTDFRACNLVWVVLTSDCNSRCVILCCKESAYIKYKSWMMLTQTDRRTERRPIERTHRDRDRCA